MQTTTQRIYKPDMDTIKMWMYVLEVKSFAELIHKWITEVDLQKKREFYSKLTPRITKPVKPLIGKKINKLYTEKVYT